MLDSDTLTGFFFYVFFVSPVLTYVLKPGRFSSRKKALMYAMGFLLAVAILTVGIRCKEQSTNFYRLLDLNRDATLAQMKRAYRTQSILTHPDKKSVEDKVQATEDFNRIRLAFDILSDTDKRKIYDMYGEEAILDDSHAD